MRDTGAAALAVGIPFCLGLETVNLHACGIGDEGARAVAAVMRNHRRDQALHIYLTGNECVVQLSHAVQMLLWSICFL